MIDRMSKYGWRILAALFAATTLVSCSLMKVAVSTGDPLPKEEMNIRIMTRGFYYDLASEVARAADSISSTTRSTPIRIAASRWKIRTTRAAVTAAMQGIPDVALADLWILCHRMDEQFVLMPDSLLFGPGTPIARETAENLKEKIRALARETLSSERYGLMEHFVSEYTAANPTTDADRGTDNTTLAWMNFLKANGVDTSYATGSIAEVLADVNDRLSGHTQQISNSIGWSKDILEMQLRQDSIRTELGAQLDSLERNFKRMVVVAENLPEISDKMLSDMNTQLGILIESINSSVDNAFIDVDRQRRELQHYISHEREAFTDQLRTSADEVVQGALDAIPMLVGQVLLYLVLGLGALIGGPFAVGFWLGGVRARAKMRKDQSPKDPAEV